MDAIYQLFSHLLDKKLDEMQRTRVDFVAGTSDSDIEDNYMMQIKVKTLFLIFKSHYSGITKLPSQQLSSEAIG